MNKQIFVINGSGGVGKDTFVELVSVELNDKLKKFHTVVNFSSVDKVKEIAREIGWDGRKSEKDRKFLSDLKSLTNDYCDMPFLSMKNKVAEFMKNDEGQVLFLHIREPEEIKRVVDEFGAKTILIVRDSVMHITSNMSDKNIFDYHYDFVIENNGTIEELQEKVRQFINKTVMIESEWCFILNKPTIYCDLDNTILNSIKAICDMYNEDYRYYKNYYYIHWTDISTWDFKECTCTKTKHIKRYFMQPRFFEKVEFMDNAKEVLSRLKDKYEIVIVSIGVQPNLFGKEIWIKDNLPFAKFIGVDMEKYKDKSCIDMSDGILIDDEQRYLDSSNANVKICFGDVYEWNEYWKGKRCFNWIELENYLMEGSEHE